MSVDILPGFETESRSGGPPWRLEPIIAGLLVLAFVLRLVNSDVAFLHFNYDEAEYATRARYILEHGGVYPVEKLFDHPPLWPYTLSGVFAVLGPASWSARLTSSLLGALTVPVIAWAGWLWRGPRSGVISGALAAVQPLLVRVSRTSLIEPLLGLFVALLCAGIARGTTARDAPTYALLGVGGAGMFLTKASAILLVPGVLAYVIWTGMLRDRRAWIALAAALMVVVPVYSGMLAAGFPGVHTSRAGEEVVYGAGEGAITPGAGASLTFLIPWMHVLLIPLVVGAALVIRDGDDPGRAYALMLGVVLLFLAVSPLRGLHYLYLLGIPGVLLGAIALRNHGWVAAAVCLVLLTVSVLGITGDWSAQTVREAHLYIGGESEPGDRVLSGDHPVFEWYYPHLETLPATPSNLATRPDFIVLDKEDQYVLSGEPAFSEYDVVQVIENEEGEEWYRIYRHGSS